MRHLILVVDDNADALRTLIDAIGKDHDVLTAADGLDALVLLETQPVHVLLADERMPNMTGTVLLREVRTRYPSVVRLLFTAGSSEMVLDAINTGLAYRYLPKPYTRPEFRDVIKSACDKYERGTVMTQIADLRTESRVRGELVAGRLDRNDARLEAIGKTLDRVDMTLSGTRHQVASVGTRVAEVEQRVDEELSSPGVDVGKVIEEVRRQQSSLSDHEGDIEGLRAQIAAIQGERSSGKPPPTLVEIEEQGAARGLAIERKAKSGIIVAGAIVASAEVVLEVLKHVWK